MLCFRPIELEGRETYNRYAFIKGYRNCEMSFVDQYIWKHKYLFEHCEVNGFMFVRLRLCRRQRYFLPLGSGDLANAVGLIREDARRHGWEFVMIGLSEQAKNDLEAAMPGKFDYADDRNNADYLYNSSDLINLSGPKYHSKRNFINRFSNLYKDRYAYEPISSENMADVWAFQREWCRKNDCISVESLMDEQTAISTLLDNFDKLGAAGGLIRVEKRVAAFTVGSPISKDTFGIQVEKADYEIAGAYPMINWEFARKNCGGYAYINREEDMGVEGLRRAKLSYHPAELVRKYNAIPKDE